MDPRYFYQLALGFSTSKKAEEQRTAIGRAYYAAYNVAAFFLRGLNVKIEKKPESHKKVQEYLSNSGDIEITKVAQKLDSMRIMRNHADYDMENPISENSKCVEINVTMADDFIKTIDKCCVEQVRLASVKEKVQKWRQDNNYL